MKEYIQLLLQLFVVSMQYTDATGKNLYIEPLFGRDFVYKFAKSAAKTPVFSSWALTLDGSLSLRMFFHLWKKPQHESWLPFEIWNSTSFVRARDSSTQPSKSLIIGRHFFFFFFLRIQQFKWAGGQTFYTEKSITYNFIWKF